SSVARARRWSASAGISHPSARSTSVPSITSAATRCRAAPWARPDQSTATTRRGLPSPAMSIGVFAKLTAAPGKRDELMDVLGTHFPNVEGEEGTLIYAMHADNDDA